MTTFSSVMVERAWEAAFGKTSTHGVRGRSTMKYPFTRRSFHEAFHVWKTSWLFPVGFDISER